MDPLLHRRVRNARLLRACGPKPLLPSPSALPRIRRTLPIRHQLHPHQIGVRLRQRVQFQRTETLFWREFLLRSLHRDEVQVRRHSFESRSS